MTFPVGLHELHDPLVQVKHLKLHVLFLGALHDLRRRVESINEASWPPLISELDGERRWSWFVNLAVERQVPNFRIALTFPSAQPTHMDLDLLTGFSVGLNAFRHP